MPTPDIARSDSRTTRSDSTVPTTADTASEAEAGESADPENEQATANTNTDANPYAPAYVDRGNVTDRCALFCVGAAPHLGVDAGDQVTLVAVDRDQTDEGERYYLVAGALDDAAGVVARVLGTYTVQSADTQANPSVYLGAALRSGTPAEVGDEIELHDDPLPGHANALRVEVCG